MFYMKSKQSKDRVSETENELKIARDKLGELNAENDRLTELNEILQNEKIITFENGKYVDAINEVIMILGAEHKVSLKVINPVISAVLERLTGKLPDRLPAHSAQIRILQEAKFLAKKTCCKRNNGCM